MLVHNAYAVNGLDKKPLGLLDQQIMVRQKRVKTDETRQERLSRRKESEKWTRGLITTHKLLSGHNKVIQVCDREADIYFFIKQIQELGHGFVIRCANQRRSTIGGNIFEEIKKANHIGSTDIEIPRNGNRKKRIASVDIASCKVQLKAPKIINRSGSDLTVNIAIFEERKFQDNPNRLLWVLLTSEDVQTYEDCLKVVKYYQSRRLIEEFHKGLKTGCKTDNYKAEKNSVNY